MMNWIMVGIGIYLMVGGSLAFIYRFCFGERADWLITGWPVVLVGRIHCDD